MCYFGSRAIGQSAVSRHVSTQGVFAISVWLLFALLAAEERGEPEDDDGADDGCADLTD